MTCEEAHEQRIAQLEKHIGTLAVGHWVLAATFGICGILELWVAAKAPSIAQGSLTLEYEENSGILLYPTPRMTTRLFSTKGLKPRQKVQLVAHPKSTF